MDDESGGENELWSFDDSEDEIAKIQVKRSFLASDSINIYPFLSTH